MKKYIILFLSFLLMSNVYAKEPNVKIDISSDGHVIDSVIKFKILDGDKSINDTIYKTNNKGYFEGNINIDKSTYLLEVVEAPSNILTYKAILRVVDGKIDMKINYNEITGTISIRRYGTIELNENKIHSMGQISEYEIIAAETIDSHTGTKFKKNEIAKTVKTEYGYGHAILPLGKYYVREKNTYGYIKDNNTYTYELTETKRFFEHSIDTKHLPLKIETNEDYKLCLIDDILNDREPYLVMEKGKCFDKHDSYHIPYGKYILKTKEEEKIIDFNQDNTEFVYKKNTEPNFQNIDNNSNKSYIPKTTENIIVEHNPQTIQNIEMPKTDGRKSKSFLLLNGLLFLIIGIKRNHF